MHKSAFQSYVDYDCIQSGCDTTSSKLIHTKSKNSKNSKKLKLHELLNSQTSFSELQ